MYKNQSPTSVLGRKKRDVHKIWQFRGSKSILDPDTFEKHRNFYRDTLQKYRPPLAESSIYTTKLYHDTPPICIAMLLAEVLGSGVFGKHLLTSGEGSNVGRLWKFSRRILKNEPPFALIPGGLETQSLSTDSFVDKQLCGHLDIVKSGKKSQQEVFITWPDLFRPTESGTEKVPQRLYATKILPNFWVNFLVRFASKPLFCWVVSSNCSEDSLVLFTRVLSLGFFFGPRRNA